MDFSERAEYRLYCRIQKNFCRFKGQARNPHSDEQCGLKPRQSRNKFCYTIWAWNDIFVFFVPFVVKTHRGEYFFNDNKLEKK